MDQARSIEPTVIPEAPKLAPGLQRFKITDEKVAHLANPGCKHCYGTGSVGSVTAKDRPKIKILCSCVQRALRDEGRTPWLLKRKRKERT